MRKLKMLALGAVLFAAAGASAGPLVSASYTQTIQGVPFTINAVGATGSLTGSSFTLDAGNAFASALCIGNPGNAACIANPTGPFAPPVTRINISFTMNGPLAGTTMDSTITQASGLMGTVLVMAKIGKAPSFTLLPIAVNAGAGGNVAIPPTSATPTFTTATLKVYLAGDVWHLGNVTQTMLTNMFVTALPDATGMGNVSATMSAGGMNFVHVNLVTLGRTKVRGLANSDTSTPSFLRLVYAPEPGTLMLLGAGIAGLALIGRRKLQ